jgi:xanthine dehydrogenase small subunit
VRQHVLLFVNGERYVVTGENALLSLSDFLRVTLRSTGTKIVCAEGDCGSCSVLIGKLGKGNIRYKAIDSCIAFVFQLDGYHVVTVEGLSCAAHADGTWQGQSGLSQVQHAMVEKHGSQCGFCTPGFVVAMTGIMEDCSATNQEPTLNDWRLGLTGNLCRCTGYTPILSACQHISASNYQSLETRYPSESLTSQYAPFRQDDLQVGIPTSEQSHCVYSPVSLNAAIALKDANPDARLVAGATDAGVQRNKGAWKPQSILSLDRHPSLLRFAFSSVSRDRRSFWLATD